MDEKNQEEAVKIDYSQEEQELAKMREEASASTLPDGQPAEESLPPKTEEVKEETPEPKPVVSAETQQQPEDNEEKPLSARAQNRFQELANARKEAEAKAERLEAERNSLLSVLNNPTIPQEGGEITQEQYQADVDKRAKFVVEQTLKEERDAETKRNAQKNFVDDYKTVKEKFPVLNGTSPDFDPELDEMVGDYYATKVVSDPTIRLTTVVEKFVKQREKGAEQAKKEKADRIATQAGSQAVVTSGGRIEAPNIEREIAKADSRADLKILREKINSL